MAYDLDALRRDNPVSAVVGRYVRLTKNGPEFEACCPFHNEKTPSFTVNDAKGFYHCLAGETLLVTSAGTGPISSLAGTTATVLTRGGKWVDAKFAAYGTQRLYKISLSRNGVKREIFATSGHRWFARGRSSETTTLDLRPGHRLESVLPAHRSVWQIDPAGVRHGVVFGDGSVQRKYGRVVLHGEKGADLEHWFGDLPRSRGHRENGAPFVDIYGGITFEHLKKLPGPERSDGYLLGFIAGYLATDGCVDDRGDTMLNSATAANLQWVRDTALRLGIGTFHIGMQMRQGYGATETPLYRVNFIGSTLSPDIFLRPHHRSRFESRRPKYERLGWVVRSVEETDRIEEVYCAEVPGEHAFALADNLLTGNCFGCGAHGDQFDFIIRHDGCTFPEACERLGSTPSGARPVQSPKSEPEPEAVLEPVEATDDDLPIVGEAIKVWNPKRKSWPTFTPAAVFPYRTDLGAVIGAVIRVDTAPGHKITPQIRLARLEDGTVAWALWSFPRPRPLYGLEMLDTDGEVWVLEGEKKVDAARTLGYQAVAWPGGSNGHTHVDWTPLRGRDLLLLCDNDEPGIRCMLGYIDEHQRFRPGVAQLAQPRRVRVIGLDPDKPKGHDICDLPIDEVEDYVERHVRDLPPTHAESPQDAGLPQSRETPRQPTQGFTGPEPSKPSPAAEAVGADEHRMPKQDGGPTFDTRPTHTDARPEPPHEEQDDGIRGLNDEEREREASATHDSGAASDDADETAEIKPPAPARKTTRNGHAYLNGHAQDDDSAPFRILGHNRGIYYYLPNGTQQVVEITASQHTQAQMVSMADLSYWEGMYEGKNSRSKFDVAAAENAMVRSAEGKGIFVPDRLRGRGAWIDKGRPVIHLGPEVYIDDVGYKPSKAPSDFIYEAAAPLHVDRKEPASTEEAHHLVDICSALSWENPLSAQLLAGFCVIAPICGALDYRPHIWVTGPSTAGKTTVIKVILERVIGPFAVRRDGTTTEAHLRQTLFHDARPVILDEAESDDKVAAMRMRALLELSRISSDGGTIGKGGKDGQAIEYTVRACFCYSSINVAIANYADDSRISRLVLRRRDDEGAEAHFKKLSDDIGRHLGPDYAAKMFARSVANLPTLLHNVRIFTDACATVLGSRRAANQIGTLLAGLYLCHSVKKLTYEAAIAWVKERKWGDHTALDSMKDEERMLSFILTHRRKLTTSKGARELTIGELIEIGVSGGKQDDVDAADANRELGRIGIKIDCRPGKEAMFVIANRSPELSRMLDGKPWANDWKRSLRSLGGTPTGSAAYFTQGLTQHGTALPVEMIRG